MSFSAVLAGGIAETVPAALAACRVLDAGEAAHRSNRSISFQSDGRQQ
jgi:hypothetical protein